MGNFQLEISRVCYSKMPLEGEKGGFKLTLFLQKRRQQVWENIQCFTEKAQSSALLSTASNLLTLLDARNATSSARKLLQRVLCAPAGSSGALLKTLAALLSQSLKAGRNYPLIHRAAHRAPRRGLQRSLGTHPCGDTSAFQPG